MVFLNGQFIKQQHAKISTLDRGFLFADGIYEVIPVYNGNLFNITGHLLRLNNNLIAIDIKSPYTNKKYIEIITKLIKFNNYNNQIIYLQITRGADNMRSHTLSKILTPTIYIRSEELMVRSKNALKVGFSAIIRTDIRWQLCSIKSVSLLANVLYAIEAKKQAVEEVILHKNNIITEGASSNIFILKNNIVYTPQISNQILPGITRQIVIKSIKQADIKIIERDITVTELLSADEVWISSSSREIMPITQIEHDDNNITKKVSTTWGLIYDNFQQFKLK